MKWLKSIFPGSKVRGEAVSLPLLDIDSWLEDRQRDSGFEECLGEIYDRLDAVSKGLSKDVSALISAEPDPSTPPKLLRAGLAARGELVKQMESMNEKLMPPKKKRHRINLTASLGSRQRSGEDGNNLWKSATVCRRALPQMPGEHQLRPDTTEPPTGRTGERNR